MSFFFFFYFYFIFKLYIIILVLPIIKMNPPQVYMCSLFDYVRSSLQHAGSVLCCARGLSGCGVCASAVVACGVSCSAACGILVSRPEIEPKSPALQGGVLTTGPPGMSPKIAQLYCVFWKVLCCFVHKFLGSFPVESHTATTQRIANPESKAALTREQRGLGSWIDTQKQSWWCPRRRLPCEGSSSVIAEWGKF